MLLLLFLLAFPAAGYVAWNVKPAYTLSAAVVLSPMSGNWGFLGIPGVIAPDRLLLVAGIGAVLLRGPAVAGRPRIRLTGVHLALLAAAVWAVGSAIAAGSIADRGATFQLLEAYGILPFLLFVVAPVAFATAHDRSVLLGALTALGAYLSIIAVLETLNLHSLTFPRYIAYEDLGIHFGRARGPFLEAVANGLALYACMLASAIAYQTWHSARARLFAAVTGVSCAVSTFFTLQRSIWLAVVLGTIAALIGVRSLRRFAVPALAAGVIGIAAALALVPGLPAEVQERRNDNRTVWERENLNRAALNMGFDHPLLGVGWDGFDEKRLPYFEQADDYPLIVTDAPLHNVFLTYAVELGLIGVTLWIVALVLGVGGALNTVTRDDLTLWRHALVALAVAWAVIINFVPPYTFTNLIIWLWAGTVWAARNQEAA